MPVFLDKQILVFLGCDYLREMVGAKVVLVVVVEVLGGGEEARTWCEQIF